MGGLVSVWLEADGVGEGEGELAIGKSEKEEIRGTTVRHSTGQKMVVDEEEMSDDESQVSHVDSLV